MPNPLYFAYGSNLNPQQMRRRCPGALAEGRAVLRGYRLAFAGHSRLWGGPVATLVRDRDAEVDGVLYRLPRAELAVLDRFEGHPFCYRRARRDVRDVAGRRRRANVYLMHVDEEDVAPPAPPYLTALWRAYRTHGFDATKLAVAAGGGVR